MRRSISALLLILLAGCTHTRGRNEPPTGPTFARKHVVEKRPPIHLVAGDRTICSVSEEKFRTTKVDDAVWCVGYREGIATDSYGAIRGAIREGIATDSGGG